MFRKVKRNSTYLSPAGFGAVEKPHAVDSQGKNNTLDSM
jgi:hypothetical protein